MEKEIFLQIINTAINAPSGENSQPWRFVCKNNFIEVYNLPDRDNPIYNFKQHGSLFAHGALFENISIIASSLGLKVDIDIIIDYTTNLIARIHLNKKENESQYPTLISSINKRATNRKKYDNKEISEDILKSFYDIVKSDDSVDVYFIDKQKNRDRMARVFSLNDMITLEDKKLHNVFFEHIRWNKEEEQKYKNGLFLDTLELAPPQEKIFTLLKNPKIAFFFRKIRLTKFIAHENAKVYASSPLFISFVIKNNEENYIRAGMLAERIWLQAIHHGLSCQPLAALPYLYDRISHDNKHYFSDYHKEIIISSYHDMCELLRISTDEMVAMTFRIGFASPPRAYSSKMQPDIDFV